ncbi:MAG TPA: mandelate racemase/muconate lactonizing enzyme family protein [Phototrophicaceae bacterium]|nr:mandelate racemase/muconate lactonizing enzyme family protein [Phototrophicaceae bacterium]
MSDQPQIVDHVNTYSRPSDLRITDLRIANLVGLPMDVSLIRLDTNQGICGYGEVRDWASKTYALMLKSRILGENPCNIDKIFRKIKQFGHHARQAGGVCGIEMALMDLAGKAYHVPAYQLAGGKFRDRVLCYCDTPSTKDPLAMGARLKKRMDMGFKFLKMDVGIDLVADIPGAISAPPEMLDTHHIMHPFTGIQLTKKGVDLLVEYVAAVRGVVGDEVPLAADHFGHLNLESCIKLGRALDPFTLAWYEDMIPWQFADQYLRLSQAVTTPICTGEDIYLKEGFKPLIEARAVSIIHPDLATSGGILETKRIGDYAQEHGIAMAMHMAGSPVAAMASVHCAAATENFFVLENHSMDIARWNDLCDGLSQPLIVDGYIQVPEAPGLGLGDINLECLREFIDPRDPLCFDSTDLWDQEHSHDRLWS